MDDLFPKCSRTGRARVTQGWDLRLAESNRSHLDLKIHVNPFSKSASQEAQPRMTKDPLGESSLVISPAVHPKGLLLKFLPGEYLDSCSGRLAHWSPLVGKKAGPGGG